MHEFQRNNPESTEAQAYKVYEETYHELAQAHFESHVLDKLGIIVPASYDMLFRNYELDLEEKSELNEVKQTSSDKPEALDFEG
jgi:hypothetical protein